MFKDIKGYSSWHSLVKEQETLSRSCCKVGVKQDEERKVHHQRSKVKQNIDDCQLSKLSRCTVASNSRLHTLELLLGAGADTTLVSYLLHKLLLRDEAEEHLNAWPLCHKPKMATSLHRSNTLSPAMVWSAQFHSNNAFQSCAIIYRMGSPLLPELYNWCDVAKNI